MFQIWLTILYGLWNEYTIGYGHRRKSCAFPVGKESAVNVGDPGSIPGLGRSAGEGIGCPLQYSWANEFSKGQHFLFPQSNLKLNSCTNES